MPEFYHIALPASTVSGVGQFAAPLSGFHVGVLASIVAAGVCAFTVYAYRMRLRPFIKILGSILLLHRTLSSINMRVFNRSRDDYKRRHQGATISEYVGSARSSVKIVGFTLITALQYEELGTVLQRLAECEPPVDVEISLLNPKNKQLLRAISPAYDTTPEALSTHITNAMNHLLTLRAGMKPTARQHLRLYFHDVIPFASAILIDTDQKSGRVQIETKAYKTGLHKSWGFEIGAGGKHDFYKTLVDAYTHLIRDSKELDTPQGPLVNMPASE